MATITNQENDRSSAFFTRAFTPNWEVVIYVAIFLLAMFTRFYGLGDRVMSHDESLHTVYSNNLYEQGTYNHNPMMHGPVLFHFTALSYFLFGVDDFSARIYPAILGVILVLFPILFRRWIGRTGAILASIMLLSSPLLMYYSRYIRHDIPSILSGMIMFWACMMYLSGPENQRRRAHWLYVLSAAMLWNLGSKETSFIYIAIFGAFLTLYWIVRLVQHFYNIKGKVVFYALIVGILLAGVMALAMIVVVSVSLGYLPTLSERISFLGDQFGFLLTGEPVALGFSSFLNWIMLVLAVMAAIIVVPARWAYRREDITFSLPDAIQIIFAIVIFVALSTLLSPAVGLIAAIIVSLVYIGFRIDSMRPIRSHALILVTIMLVVCGGLILAEELSHVPSRADEIAAPPVPGEETEIVEVASTFTVMPLILIWMIAVVVIAGIFYAKQRGWWDVLDLFPEFDVLMVMGSLILPWLAAVFIVATRGSPTDYAEIGSNVGGLSNLVPVTGAEQVGRVIVGFIAWVPMAAIAVVAGLSWNWRRWLMCSAIFHALFAFFFTTVFTNIEGLATGWVYGLQYWLEQQGERRGSQPQYYYLLVIMPFYEFLPIIGSVLAMIAGMIVYWRKRLAFETDENITALLLEEKPRLSEDSTTDEDEVETPTLEAIVGIDEQDREIESLVAQTRNEASSRWRLIEVPFLLFLSWWAILNLVGYTLAGEKMPWLGTHITIPMILLSAWYFGRVIDRLDRRKFFDRGWIYLLLLPFLFVALFRIIAPYLGGQLPFSGTQEYQLQWTYNWLAVVAVSVAILYAIFRLIETTGWPHLRHIIAVVTFSLLAVITFRSGWLASFIYYDEATEFLVYAHAAPGNKIVTDELRELSIRITDGMDVRVLHDDKFSWPGSWYMRDFDNALFIGSNAPTLQQLDDTVAVIVGSANRPKVEPLLEDRFQRFDHIRMWWPIQDYFGLSAERVTNLLSLSSESAGGVRRGIFDIWWSRDYTTYGQAAGRSITLTEWPVADRMHFYVRKDYAAQIWPYGVGDATVLNPFTEIEVNACTANWDPRPASVIFDTSTQPLLRPLGVSVSDDGYVYVADEGSHRINVFDTDGNPLTTFGEQGVAMQDGAFFERPHSVALDSENNIFVVDTWNYRIRAFTSEFEFITGWGQPLTSGFDAQIIPEDGFWGPRDIAIDGEGRIYVADTGNKRIRVYASDGTYIHDIGSGGAGDGQLNEPAGIALHPDGLLYVADTWNRRVTVFTLDGSFVNNFTVRGWYDDLGNRPYLAIDPMRELLYITDSDAGRVLIYDTDGNCLSSFGQFNQDAPNAAQFATVGGIAVDNDGNVFVTDYAAGRVLKFDPYERPETGTEIEAEDGGGFGGSGPAVDAIADQQAEFTPDIIVPENTVEVNSDD